MRVVLTLILLNTGTLFSQNYQQLAEAKTGSSTYLLNDCILGNKTVFYSLETKSIRSVKVHKENQSCECPEDENIPLNLLKYKLVHLKCNSTIKTKTQAELNSFWELEIDTPVYLDGFLIDNSYFEIATYAIIEIEKIKPNESNNLNKEVLNIWTLPKDKRYLPVSTKN